MPSLILMFKNKQLMKYTLLDGATITIGRHNSNDMVIDNLVVSGLHAHVDYQDGDITITDLQSKNGTYRNGERISQAVLQHGDLITIGKHNIKIDLEDDNPDHKSELNRKPGMNGSKTMSLEELGEDPEIGVSTLAGDMVTPSPSSTEAKSAKTSGSDYLVWLSGGRGRIKISDGQTQIGKNEDAQIIVKGLRASLVGTPAAVINKQAGEYWLTYTNGVIKPKRNGQTVKGRVKLSHKDTISVGPAKLELQIHSRD